MHGRAVESFRLTDVILLVLAAVGAVGWLALVASWALVTAFITSDPAGAPWIGTIFTAASYQYVFVALFAASLGCYVAWWLYRTGRASRYA